MLQAFRIGYVPFSLQNSLPTKGNGKTWKCTLKIMLSSPKERKKKLKFFPFG